LMSARFSIRHMRPSMPATRHLSVFVRLAGDARVDARLAHP
jgi:hypothetical protein